MLHNLRAASETWIGRIVTTLLMGFIVFSFAIFGIGDILRNIGAGGALATVGGVEISPDAFRGAYERQLQNASQRVGRKITNDEARAAGLDKQLIDQFVNEAALDQRAKALGLAASDDLIRQRTAENPQFARPGGKFDPNLFNQTLRENNLNEAGYVVEQRKALMRRQIAEALTTGVEPPKALSEAFGRLREETRSIEYVLLPEAAAGDVAPPSEEELRQFFAARAQNYTAPEYRKLIVLALRPDTLAKPEAVSDAAALKLYEEVRPKRYTTAETRKVQQIPFPDEASAKAARERIKAGAGFDAIAAERKLAEADIDLGTVVRDGLLGDVGKAAFELPENEVSEPVKTLLGFSLIRVAKINPAIVAPYDGVAGGLKKELAAGAAKREMNILRDKIEDARASGKPLAEAAKAAGLEAQTIEAVDGAGRDKQGRPALAQADAAVLARAAFASDVGVDNDTVQTKDGATIWFEVAAIEPAHGRGFEEMRTEIEKNWRADAVAKRLIAKAAELVKQLNGGAAIADIAKAEGGLEVKSVNDVKRQSAGATPPGLAAQVFNTPMHRAGASAAPEGRIVFFVNAAVVPALDLASNEAKTFESQARAALAEELTQQYIDEAKEAAGVKINQDAVRQIIGGESGAP